MQYAIMQKIALYKITIIFLIVFCLLKDYNY